MVNPNPKPKISIVIPTFNGGSQFEKLLATIKGQNIPIQFEIVIIDSGSTDQTLELAKAAGARILQIAPTDFNHGRARNQAIQTCAGDFIVLTVQDAIPVNNKWLDQLLVPLLDDSRIAGSHGLQLAPPTADLLSRTKNALWTDHKNSSSIVALENHKAFQKLPFEDRIKLLEFDNVTSCIRRTVWEKTPFPELAFAEDMAWAKQVLFQGYSIAFNPEAQVWHYHERSWFYDLRRAYANGLMQVELVQRPSSALSSPEATMLLVKAIHISRNKQFDTLVNRTSITSFISSKVKVFSETGTSRLDQISVEIFKFAETLSNKAFCLTGEKLPEGTWSSLLRFATISKIGDHLGTSAAMKLDASPLPQRVFWRVLHHVMMKRI